MQKETAESGKKTGDLQKTNTGCITPYYWKRLVTAGASRRDICHKQRLCKIFSTLDKISYGEQMSSVIFKELFVFYDKLILISEESLGNFSYFD